jgi:hypothetical protein
VCNFPGAAGGFQDIAADLVRGHCLFLHRSRNVVRDIVDLFDDVADLSNRFDSAFGIVQRSCPIYRKMSVDL